MWFENQRTLNDFNSLTVKTRIALNNKQKQYIPQPTTKHTIHSQLSITQTFQKNDVDFYTQNTKESIC